MKGLLKNNFYAVCSSTKVFSAFMFLLGAFATIVISQQLLIFYMLLGLIGFPVCAFASMGKEYTSKWGRYKLTTPVKRAEIVKSYFISQIMWLFVGMGFAGAGMGLAWLLHGCPFDRNIDALMVLFVGVSISFFAGAIFFPLFYLDGEERSGVFVVISLLCAIGIVMGITTGINFLFGPAMPVWKILLGAVIMVICALLTFVLSYPLTIFVFKRKEY